MTPESNWFPPEILPKWEGADALVVDLETYDPGLKDHGAGWAYRDGHVAGVAIGIVQGEHCTASYLPIKHGIGANLDAKRVLRYVKAAMASDIPKVFHNAMYDIGWLSTKDIKVNGPLYDTMFGAALIDEDRKSYSLDNVGSDWVGLRKDESLLHEAAGAYGIPIKQTKSRMWELPPQFVGPYAEQDVTVTHAIWHHEQKLFKADSQLEDLRKIETALIPLWISMRQAGVRVDVPKTEKLVDKLNQDLKNLLNEIFRRYGTHVAIWANDSIALAFDNQNLSYGRTPTGKPSFTKEFLGGHEHELPHMILEARNIEKTINTFFKGMILENSHKGRIHTEFHPLRSDEGGTVSGRVSSSHPNLQQVSARHPVFGPMVRELFLPELDTLWGVLDYSSQEPRLTVHYAALTGQTGAEAAVEAFAINPKTDYHQMVADIAGISRKDAKTINLGLAYGMGEVKLCESLGLPVEQMRNERTGKSYSIAGPEGKALLAAYHEKVPFIKGLTSMTSNRAANTGAIRTLGGRLCRFDWREPKQGGMPIKGKPENGSSKRAFTHKALNRLIQGSAADMTKIAMLEIHKQGIVPMLQMHDELDFSFGSEKEARLCQEIMETSVELLVPVIVDAEFGPTWAEANKTYTDKPWKGLH